MTKTKSFFILLTIMGLSILLISQFFVMPGDSAVKRPEARDPDDGIRSFADPDVPVRTITAAVSLDEEEFAVLEQLTASFEEQNGRIAVELVNLPAPEAYETLKKESQLGSAPDLMLLDNAWVQEFAALGYLQPADEYLSGEQHEQRVSAMVNQLKWNGYMWGVPFDVDPYILVWNRTAAGEYGWDRAPETADEMVEWNRTMMKPEEGRYGIYVDLADPHSFIALAGAMAGTLPETGTPLGLLASLEAVQRLQSFLLPDGAEWSGSEFARRFPAASKPFDPWSLLEKGEIAAMVTTVSEYNRHRRDQLAIAALPYVTAEGKKAGGWLKGRSFVVSSQSEQLSAAIEWIEYLTTPEAALAFWNGSKTLPALLAAYQEPALAGDDKIESYQWLINEGIALEPEIDTAKKMAGLAEELAALRETNDAAGLREFAGRIAEQWQPPA